MLGDGPEHLGTVKDTARRASPIESVRPGHSVSTKPSPSVRDGRSKYGSTPFSSSFVHSSSNVASAAGTDATDGAQSGAGAGTRVFWRAATCQRPSSFTNT